MPVKWHSFTKEQRENYFVVYFIVQNNDLYT